MPNSEHVLGERVGPWLGLEDVGVGGGGSEAARTRGGDGARERHLPNDSSSEAGRAEHSSVGVVDREERTVSGEW